MPHMLKQLQYNNLENIYIKFLVFIHSFYLKAPKIFKISLILENDNSVSCHIIKVNLRLAPKWKLVVIDTILLLED